MLVARRLVLRAHLLRTPSLVPVRLYDTFSDTPMPHGDSDVGMNRDTYKFMVLKEKFKRHVMLRGQLVREWVQ